MKIGVDVRVLIDKQYSGVSEYAYNLLRELLISDKENEYVFYYNYRRDLKDIFKEWDSPRITFKRTPWPNKFFNYILQKIFTWPSLDMICGDIDVFWSPHLNFSSFSNPKVKKIITIHDLSFLRYPKFFSHRKNFWHKNLRITKLLKKYDQIIAISENTKRDLMALLNIPEEKITVIYSGLNKNDESLDSDEARLFAEKNKISDDFILYLGNIEPRKNVKGLIEAYSSLRDRNLSLASCKLVLAGAKAWKNKDIYYQAKKSLYRDDIIFLGYINKKEKKYLYKKAKIFTYPSYYEGFGFPPLEAMSNSLAVITSDASSLPEVVGTAALIINPCSVLDLSAAMETLLLDDELRLSYEKAGLKRSEFFNWNKTALKYLETFK